MTDREKAIVMAYTGICMLKGDKFQIFHKYVDQLIGRPVLTHEIGILQDTIKERSKADFIALCEDDTDERIVIRKEEFRRDMIKTLQYNGCKNCQHQIAPLRSCKWAEQGGDGRIHYICPKWDKKEED